MAGAELAILIRARDEASRILGDVAKAAQTTQSRMASASKSLTQVGRTAGLAAGIGAAAIGTMVKGAADFDKAMREVNTLVQLTEPELLALKDQVSGLSQEMGVGAVDAAGALYQAISAGVPAKNAFQFLQDAAKLGIAGVATTEEAVSALTGVMNAFQSESLSAAESADVLFTTVRLGKTTLSELAPAMGIVAPAAAAAGVSLRETAAALASVTKIIPNVSMASSSLRQVFGEADKAGSKFNKALKELGADTMGEAVGQFGSFQAVLQTVYEATGNSDVAFKNLFGSVEGANAALTLVGSNAATAASDLASMNDATGASETAFVEMSKAASFQLDIARQGMEALRREIGGALMPSVLSLMRGITNLLKPVIAWIQQNPELTRTIGTVVVAVVALTAAVSVFSFVAGTALGAVAALMGLASKVVLLTKAWTAAQWLLNVALGANPIGAVILLITGLIAALTVLVGWMIWARKGQEDLTEATDEYSGAVVEANKVILERIAAFEALADAEAEAAEATRKHLENQVEWSRDALLAVEELRDASAGASAAHVKYLDDLVATARVELELAERVAGVKKEIANKDMIGLKKMLDDTQALHEARIETYISGLQKQADRAGRVRVWELEQHTEAYTAAQKRIAEAQHFWYEKRLAARKKLFADSRAIAEEQDTIIEAQNQAAAADAVAWAEAFVAGEEQKYAAIKTARDADLADWKETQKEKRAIAEAVAEEEMVWLLLAAKEEARILAERTITAKEFADYKVRRIKELEEAELRLKKVTVGLAAEERARLNTLIASAGGGVSRELAEREALRAKENLTALEKLRLRHLNDYFNAYDARLALSQGARESEAEARLAGLDKPKFGKVPEGFVPGGDMPPGFGIFDATVNEIAAEYNRLLDRLEKIGSLTGSEQQYLFGSSFNMARGGVIPGPIGSPQVGILHGGEEVIPAGRAGGAQYVFHFPNYVGNHRDLEEAMAKAMTQLERKGRLKAGTTR